MSWALKDVKETQKVWVRNNFHEGDLAVDFHLEVRLGHEIGFADDLDRDFFVCIFVNGELHLTGCTASECADDDVRSNLWFRRHDNEILLREIEYVTSHHARSSVSILTL